MLNFSACAQARCPASQHFAVIDGLGDQREAFELAREFQGSEAVLLAVDGELGTQTSESAVILENYSGSGQPHAVYSEAMVHAASLIAEKGWRPSAAAAEVHKLFAINPESLTADSVRKHVQRYGTAAPRKKGRALKVDAEAELQLVNVILLMRKARLPTWRSIMRKVCKGLMEGTKYATLFPNGEPGDRWWQRNWLFARCRFCAGSRVPRMLCRSPTLI